MTIKHDNYDIMTIMTLSLMNMNTEFEAVAYPCMYGVLCNTWTRDTQATNKPP